MIQGVCVRAKSVTVVLAGLLLGTAVTGCAGGDGGGRGAELSADALLDEAHKTMNALKTVTIASSTTGSAGSSYSSRQTTDLKGRCTNKITWTEGGSLEQIRIDDTDYVRPDRAYLDRWSGREAAGGKAQDRWIRTPSSNAKPGDGLVDCTWPFTAFGKAEKGDRTEIGGRPAVALRVSDAGDAEGAGVPIPFTLPPRVSRTSLRSPTGAATTAAPRPSAPSTNRWVCAPRPRTTCWTPRTPGSRSSDSSAEAPAGARRRCTAVHVLGASA